MTSIRAFSEILMEADLPDEMRARYGGIIHDEAIRLTRLLDDLLDLSVLENRKVTLDIRVANLHDLIERAIRTATEGQEGRSIRLRRDPAREHLPVITDTDRLTQVFINLIANARKYCDAAEPELAVSVRRRGARIDVDFIDNGKGIPKKAQALIFEKFSRLDAAGKAEGAGLGLAICREIMLNLGGTITYLPGQGGAAFRVTVPVRKATAEAA
jgi:signal transduction histidine kinase